MGSESPSLWPDLPVTDTDTHSQTGDMAAVGSPEPVPGPHLIDDDAVEWYASTATEGRLQDDASAGAQGAADDVGLLQYDALRVLFPAFALRTRDGADMP